MVTNTEEIDTDLMQLKALVYTPNEICKKLNIPQNLVSKKLDEIKKTANIGKHETGGFEDFFIKISAVQILERVFCKHSSCLTSDCANSDIGHAEPNSAKKHKKNSGGF